VPEDERESRESWSEQLHRRGLWQATVGYLAAGWAVIEVVSTLVDRGIVPDSLFRGALVLLALGFPVILATAYVQSPPARKGGGASAAGDATDAGFMPRRLARLLTWRNAVLGGVGAFALLGVFTAGTAVMRVAGLSAEGPPPIEPDRIAVLPFAVRGSADLAYLGEGIVDLVSSRLDGAGPVTVVDPRAVIAGVNEGRADPDDPASVDALAATLRAGQFVTGDLVDVGGRLRLTAYLHQTGRPGGAPETATVEGEADSVFAMIDGLTAKLLARLVSDDTDRLQALGTETTTSLDAAKEYLTGERLLRAGRYRDAAEAYQRATELDSTFALAHYRRSIAADWIDAYDIRSSAEQALQYGDRLSPRELGVLDAVRLRRNGRIEESERAFRARLHADPEDLEALVQYGELLFHDVGRRGRSMLESMAPFRRAVELEPANPIAVVHLARMYALADSAERLKETARVVHEFAPESERAVEIDALVASVFRDSALVDDVKSRLDGEAWYYRFYAVHAANRFARDPWLADELLAGHRDDDPLLAVLGTSVDLSLGQPSAVRALLSRPNIRDDGRWNMLEAYLFAAGALPPDSARMTALAERLSTIPGEQLLRLAWVPAYEDMSPRFMEFERDYYRAVLLMRLGRVDEARQIIDALKAEEPFVGLGTVKRDADRSLAAQLLLARGDSIAALDTLRAMELLVPHPITVQSLADQAPARFLQAELEMALGDPETAKAYFTGLDELWSPWEAYFRPRIYERLGRLAEREGDADEAIRQYTRFVDFWADCDPELVPLREDVRARRDALVRARS
jgi:tetratricopeptide (TPR) repeat protein